MNVGMNEFIQTFSVHSNFQQRHQEPTHAQHFKRQSFILDLDLALSWNQQSLGRREKTPAWTAGFFDGEFAVFSHG